MQGGGRLHVYEYYNIDEVRGSRIVEWSERQSCFVGASHGGSLVSARQEGTPLPTQIDRAEVLSIVENRVTLPQLKRSAEEIEARVREERKQEEERQARQQSIAILKID